MESLTAADALAGLFGTSAPTALASSTSAPAAAAAPNSQVILTPNKLDFYQAVVEQMKNDGLVEEARQIIHRLNIQNYSQVSEDLFQIFERSQELARLSLAEKIAKEWVPLRPRPLPPIAPQEQHLDLRNFVPIASLDDDEDQAMDESSEDHRSIPFGANTTNGGGTDVIDALAAKQVIVPPQFKTRYTAQHKQGVRCVAYSADGRLCASGSTDTSIKIMDTSKMRMFGIVQSAAGIGTQQTDDLRPVIRTFYDHVGTVTSLAFHPRQPMLFTGSADKTVKVFDLTRGGINKKALYSISDVSPINVVAPHPCGDYVFVGTGHPVIRMYDIHTQSCFSAYHQSNHHSGAILDIKTSSDGSIFASASADGNVHLWDGVNNRVINRLVAPHAGQPVLSCQWSRNNRYLLTTGGDHRARLWDVRTGRQLMIYTAQSRSSKCEYMQAQFTHNEDYVLISSSEFTDSDVSLLDARTGALLVPKLGLHAGGPCRCIASSPSESTFITGGDDFKVRYVDILPAEGDHQSGSAEY